MCLTKTHKFPKISRKPIQVYKAFNLIGDKLISPYQKQVCNIGETIKAKHSWFKGILKNKIEGEGVHAYTINIATFSLQRYYRVFYICEIPPFTPYWYGDCSDIAASKMIIKEKVEL